MLSQRLLDPPHRRGDLVSTTWRWIKSRLAMVVTGMEAQICWEMAAEKEGVERVCCHCVMAFVAENYAIRLSEVFFCSLRSLSDRI